jgi:hypothetical protein
MNPQFPGWMDAFQTPVWEIGNPSLHVDRLLHVGSVRVAIGNPPGHSVHLDRGILGRSQEMNQAEETQLQE